MPWVRNAAVIALVVLAACSMQEPLPSYGAVPAFSLQDQAGKTVTPSMLRGKIWIVDFIFTSCPDVCPMLTEQLAGVRKRLPQDAALAYVSLSVDPEHDTPAKLDAFAAQHGAKHANWLFLTGPMADVKRVVTDGFKQAMQAEPPVPGRPFNVLHGTHFVLVDQAGTLRGFYSNDQAGIRELEAAAKRLLAEGRQP